MHRSLVQALLASAITLAFSVSASAQTAVPDTVSYQGRVTDASGNAVGAGTAVNRTAYFRIYDNAAGGVRIWSEQQTITVANGEFSVLLGTGTAITGETNLNPLNAIFISKDRYLGVTIDDGVAPAESEITPRQQLVTTAFAFRAKVAESVASNAVTSGMIATGAITTNQLGDSAVSSTKIATGAVTSTQIANGAVTVTQIGDGAVTSAKISDNAVTSAKISDNAVTSAKILDGTIATADIANAAVTTAKLASDIGTWTANSGNLYRSTGNIGINTSTPGVPLTFANALGDKIALYGQSGNTYGFGIQGGLLQIHTDASGADIAFGWGSSASMGETMRIKGNGNVGIGTSTPTKGTLQIGSWANNSNLPASRVMNVGGIATQVANSATSLALYADLDIGARQFLAFSDERIKHVKGRSDAARDLAILQGIEVTDYSYIDTAKNGTGSQKKVIAQQVEKVYPQAVTRSTDEVPDIYQKASIKDGWVSLATNLKKGERVRLIGGKKEGIVEVLEVAKDRFRADFATEDGQVFVYGREVKDFRTVDYDALSMLNISATQQIKKEKDTEVKALQDANAALAARISELEKQNAALAGQNSTSVSRLEALEKRFQAFATIGRSADKAGSDN